MLKNYFKIAWRNLIKNKAHSLINIIGLSTGMAVAILIGLWIYNELSFDKFHKSYDSIAQVMQSQELNGEVITRERLPMPLGEKLRTAYGMDFEKVVMSSRTETHILTSGENKFVRTGKYMQAAATDLFSLKMLRGSDDVLKEPSSIILSRSTADALFGKADPVNKIITFDNDTTLKVTGVYEDLPVNTTLNDLSFIVPWALEPHVVNNNQNWDNNGWEAYVQLADNADMETVSAKIKDAKFNSIEKADQKYNPVIFLQPMSKWHLCSEFKNGKNVGGEIQYVWLFGIIGIIVLLLACINFMNLNTARSEKRAKEVGVRKAIGSLRSQLIKQFFTESLLVVFLSFIFSIILVIILLPFFNDVANEKIRVPFTNPFFWSAGIAFSLITALIAGSYPAFYLSSFSPVKALKGTFKSGRLAAIPRKALVVIQFAASIVLISSTIVVFLQINFARNRPVGYDRNGLINIKTLTADIHDHFEAFRDDLIKTGMVEEVAESSTQVTESNNQQKGFAWEGKEESGNAQTFATVGISKEYGKTVGWQFIDGRDYRIGKEGADALSFVLNKSAAKMMGFKNPIGSTVRWMDNDFKVIGVVEDMVMQSPFDPVEPTIFYMAPWRIDFLNIKMKPGVRIAQAVKKIEKVYNQYNSGQPFDYKFADEEYAHKFDVEQRVGKLSSFFALLAILISCLGIFGMASFMAEQRVKEIGIRKVLGASVFSLWRLLSKDFVVMVLIALLSAIPIAYYFMHKWLLNYQYRTTISGWIFLMTGLGALLITLLTVSFQAIKAAMANPVKSLRTE